MRFRAVLYDWDGTLLDSAETCFRTYETLFSELGVAFDRARFEQTYSPNWKRTYAALGLHPERWAHADRRFLELYAAFESTLCNGALETLHSLQARGVLQGVVTSGERERVAGEIRRHGLDAFFAVVVCGDEVSYKKPHPEALHVAMERIGAAPAEIAYVGDSPEDVEMARAAGAFSVGVPGGFPTRATLRAAQPDAWIDGLDGLPQALFESF